MTHEQAISFVEQKAVEQFGKQIPDMNEEEKDAVSVILESNEGNLYLIGKIEAFDNNPPDVFFYVESDTHGQSDNFGRYEEAYTLYQTYNAEVVK